MINKIKKAFKSNTIFLQLLGIFTLAIFVTVIVSLFIFISITEKTIVDNYLNSHQKIVYDISDNYDDIYQSTLDIINTIADSNIAHKFMSIQSDASNESRKASYAMNQLIKSTTQFLGPIRTNMIITSNDQIYYAFGDTRVMDHKQLNEKIEQLSHKQNLSFHILNQGLSIGTLKSPHVLVVKSYINSYTKENNYILMSYSLDDIHNIYKKFLDSPEFSVFLTKNNKTILSNTDMDFDAELYKKGSFYINEQALSLPNSEFITVINRSNLINDVYRFKTLAISLLLLITILSTLLYRVVRNITNPIYQLASQLKKTNSHEIEKISINGSYEINILVDAYNNMIDEITNYINNIISLEKKKQDSDLKALLRQIDPHFIYNTLTSIRFLIINNQADIANIALKDFIILLQSMTEFNNEKIILKEEIELLKHYTNLQKLRFGSSVIVNWNLSDNIKDVKIPKMILQPFIENALFHGFEGNGGIITVSCYKIDNNLKIEIMDNGKGMDKPTLESIKESFNKDNLNKNIGIANVQKRIQLEFGVPYGLNIHSQEGLGTIVTIVLPIII